MLIVVFPARGSALERIIFVDGRFQVIVAGDGFRNRDAIGAEFEDGGGFWSAAAVVKLKKYVEGTVGSSPDGLLAGESIH